MSVPKVIWLPEVASTNSYVKELLVSREIEEFSVFVADNQTHGKGQKGNFWESEPGQNLTFSVVLYPDFIPVNKQFMISKIVSLALVKTVVAVVGDATVKWPNDLYIGDKKVGGVLIENSIMGPSIKNSIVGIGLNVNQLVFKSNAPNPVSLRQMTGVEMDVKGLLFSFLENLLDEYECLFNGAFEGVDERYFGQLYRREGFHKYQDATGEFKARIAGVAPAGHLELLTDTGVTKSFAFKEVEFII